MKKVLGLKKITVVILVAISFNSLQGCTSIHEQNLSNTIINKNEVSSEEKDESKLINLFKLDKNKSQNLTLNYSDVKNSLIRFHVIANSDNEKDQNLKIKVKNEVIDYLYPYLNKSKSIDESRKILIDNEKQVKDIAKKVIANNNYNYDVSIELSRENFPDKAYGNIILPQGNYEAFRIIIGNGEGKNWWCVMFPPLCFVDESKAQVEYEKTQSKINEKSKQENEKSESNNKIEELIETSKDLEKKDDKKDSDNVKIKFKVVEVIKKIFK